MSDVTLILSAAKAGDPHATKELLLVVYDELRKLAAARLAVEKPDHTLQPTALVHEAYLRLVGPEDDNQWDNRGHFFAAAAEAMRRILVEHARAKGRKRRGGGMVRVEYEQVDRVGLDAHEQILDVHEALELLEAEDLPAATVVKLRFFGGLTTEQSADVMGISLRTANRHWDFARAWLYNHLNDTED
jgi:RNA polymerase sigma factor (TIGR02999 family)